MNNQRGNHGAFQVILATSLFILCAPSFAQEDGFGDEQVGEAKNIDVPFDLRVLTGNPNAAEAHANNVVVYREWDGPPLINGIPLGFKVIDGDIVVPEDAEGQTAATYATNLWPDGVIPYEFDPNVTMANANAMIAAMKWWEDVAAVDFIPRTIQQFNYIHIQANTFNNSVVGLTPPAQIINITSWNITGRMAHELGHALGFWHEQSRTDRDNFVTINSANICQNCCQGGSCNFNFQKEIFSNNYGPYDFDSVMHYGRCDFAASPAACNASCPSNTGETITVNAPFNTTWQCGSNLIPDPAQDSTFIGQRSDLSYWDSLVMSFLYPYWNWRFLGIGGFDLIGSFLIPFGTFETAYNETPVAGTLWIIHPSTHAVGPVLDKAMTIGAPLGGVVLTR